MAELIESLLFWTAVTLVSIDAYFLFFHGGVPNIRTAPAIRKKVIELLKADYAARGHEGYTIIDAGSGNGLFSREIARAMPQARVIGVEIAGQSVAWAEWLRRRAGLNNLEYRKASFFDYDFSGADAVFTFLIPSVLGPLGRKLEKDVKSGTLVISNKFRLGGDWPTPEKLDVKTLYLHQRSLYIYRKP